MGVLQIQELPIADYHAPRLGQLYILKAVQSIEVLEDAHDAADHGFKVGERLPGHSEVAVVYFDGRKIFAAVHHGTPRGLRIAFTGESYDEWIVGSTDPESLKSLIDAAR